MDVLIIITGIVILILAYDFLYEKYESKAEHITTKIATGIIVVIIVLIIYSQISSNIENNNERKQAYDEYRDSTGKTNMTDTEINKASWDEAKSRYELERNLNK